MTLQGIWLPIITPFLDDEIDYESYRRLINHYIPKGISGLIPLGTTGESPTISETEYEALIETTLQTVDNRIPVYMGVGGNYTKKVLNTLKMLERYPVQGILSVCPYYNRPSQQGLFEHFVKISEATDLNIMVYNIPYRTGINLENDTLLKLAELRNIVAVKDSCGNLKQSLDLLAHKPDDFSVLTGEDIMLYSTLVYGGNGGVLAASHIETERFVEIFRLVRQNDHQAALQQWWKLAEWIPLLFQEPNPAPVKYCLQQLNLIRSCETRLPLVETSEELRQQLEQRILKLFSH